MRVCVNNREADAVWEHSLQINCLVSLYWKQISPFVFKRALIIILTQASHSDDEYECNNQSKNTTVSSGTSVRLFEQSLPLYLAYVT